MSAASILWLQEAYERRDALAAQGARVIIGPSAWGVLIWAEGIEGIGRSWPAIASASTNPLLPTIETVLRQLKRKAA